MPEGWNAVAGFHRGQECCTYVQKIEITGTTSVLDATHGASPKTAKFPLFGGRIGSRRSHARPTAAWVAFTSLPSCTHIAVRAGLVFTVEAVTGVGS